MSHPTEVGSPIRREGIESYPTDLPLVAVQARDTQSINHADQR